MVAERIMGTPLVVVGEEAVCCLTHLIEIAEQIKIEHGVAERSVEALDEGVLVGFARLDVADLDRLIDAPGDKAGCEELRPVVTANGPGQPASSAEVLQHPDHVLGPDRGHTAGTTGSHFHL